MTGLVHWLGRHWGSIWTVVLVILVTTLSWQALDFGFHWDEPVHLEMIKQSLADETYLPGGFYHYPSFTFDLGLILRVAQRALGLRGYPQDDHGFFLIGRAVFMVLTYSSALFLYDAGRRLRGPIAGVGAASIYLLSWQLQYHARWIAPDALLTAFTAVTLWAIVIAWTRPAGRFTTWGPAIAAGLAAATKYQGAALLIPVVISTVVLWHRAGLALWPAVRKVVVSLIAFALTFIVITPGSILQPLKFLRMIKDRSDHYRTGHGVHLGAESEAIRNPAEYALALVRSIFLDQPSQWRLLSLAISVCAIVGLIVLWRRDRWLTAALLAAPLALFLYGLTLVVFIVRNFLLFLPFTALFAGVGIAFLLGLSRSTRLRTLIAAGLALLVGFGILDTWKSASSVADRGPRQLATLAGERMLEQESSTCVRLSVGVQQILTEQGWRPTKETRDPDSVTEGTVFITARELGADAPVKLAQWPGTQSQWFDVLGPREVDFSYYPRWSGADRILILTPDQLTYLGIDASELDALTVPERCSTVSPPK